MSLPEPAAHSYLGGNLETQQEYNDLRENEKYEMVIFPLSDVVLFPGETLPLRISTANFLQILEFSHRKLNSTSVQLGILNISKQNGLSEIGTTTEIRTRTRIDSIDLNDEILLTVKGRHRFTVEKFWRKSNLIFAKVLILPELQYSTQNVSFCGLKQSYNPFPKWLYEIYSEIPLAIQAWQLYSLSIAWEGGNNKACFSQWDNSNYNNQTNFIENKLHNKVQSVEGTEIQHAIANPLGFSYYLASNLPLCDKDRLSLLCSENTIYRLRLVIAHLQQQGVESQLGCSTCRGPLAWKRDVLTVQGAEGVVGAYVNPHGHVHQTVTVRQLVSGALVRGDGSPPTAQDSWFPGYEWTILYCRSCYNHLGWHFTRSEEAEMANRPAEFWGFRRTALEQVTPETDMSEGESEASGSSGEEEWDQDDEEELR